MDSDRRKQKKRNRIRGEGMKKPICLKRAGALLLTAALTLEGAGAAMPAYAEPGIPENFTVEAIRAAGITDENFAAAVYESIAMSILLGDYKVNDSWTVQEILENYNLSNLDAPEIEGNERGIKSIEGSRDPTRTWKNSRGNKCAFCKTNR